MVGCSWVRLGDRSSAVKTLMPSIISSTGGTIMKIVGFNLHSSCQGLGCMSNLFCTYSVGATSAALMISSSLALCEVPSHEHLFTSRRKHRQWSQAETTRNVVYNIARISRSSSDRYWDPYFRITQRIHYCPGVAAADAGGDLITVTVLTLT